MKTYILALFSLFIILDSSYSKDFWEPVNTPNDDPIRDITFAPNGDIYIGSQAVYKTTDNGSSWQELGEINYNGTLLKFSQTLVTMPTVAIDKNGNVFTSMTKDYAFRLKAGENNWEFLPDDIEDIHTILITESGRIFANEAYKLNYSDDGGDIWTRFEPWSVPSVHTDNKIRLCESPSGKLFASYEGVWVINPATLSYDKYTEGLDSACVLCFAFADGKVYAGTDTNGIYCSTDEGKTWSCLENSPSDVPITTLAITGSGKIFAGSEDSGLYFSTDEGASWNKSNVIFASKVINDIEIYNGEIYIATYGIYKSSDDGVTWHKIPKNPGNPIATFFDMNNSGKYYAATNLGLYHSDDGCSTWFFNAWKDIDDLDGILIGNDGKIFIWSYWTKYFLFSTDDGLSWQKVSTEFDNAGIKSVLKNSLGSLYVSITSYKNIYKEYIYISTDNGKNWEIIRENYIFWDMGIGTHDEIILEEDYTIYFSSDYGHSWEEKACPLLSGDFDFVNAFEMDGNNIWLVTDEYGIIRSTDKGNTWGYANNGIFSDVLGDVGIRDVNYICNTLYAGTEFGLFASDDYGSSWAYRDSGIIRSRIFNVNYLKDKHIYCTTFTGVYRSVDEIVSVDEPLEVDGLKIKVYPNPVVSVAMINVSSEKKTNLKLSLYSLEGKQIEEIFNGVINPGEVNIRLDAAKLPSGQYFLRAEAPANSMSTIISLTK